MIIILNTCQREIASSPEEIRGDLAHALARFDAGLVLSMPLSRPMPAIGRGVHELRFKDRSGQYRVVYALVRRDAVHVLHGFKKTTQTTPARNVVLAKSRLKEVVSWSGGQLPRGWQSSSRFRSVGGSRPS